MFSNSIHRKIYIASLILLTIGMPLSVFLMSVSQFFLATNWVLELQFRKKWQRLKQNWPALSLIGLFSIHLLWMINSNNYGYGWHDIKIKLPLLVLPILIGSSEVLSRNEIKWILHSLIFSVFISSAVSVAIYFGWYPRPYSDIREISIFISHIRLSLLVNMSLFALVYYLFISRLLYKLFYLIVVFYFIIFLYILDSKTGLLVFAVGVSFTSLFVAFKKLKRWGRFSLILVVVGFIGLIGLTLIKYTDEFYQFDARPDLSIIDKFTINGEKYQHNQELNHIENGHYVFYFIASKELEREWNKRSLIDYKTGFNANGNNIKSTLFHYLTSKNLRKDSLGLSQLTDEDIRAIEKGIGNYILNDKYSLYAKLYPLLSQIYYYKIDGYADGGTLVQRIEYLNLAKKIISNHFWFGTGTGDVDDAFKEQYNNGASVLSEAFQHRAHNQFVTFLISFGLIGFVLSMLSMWGSFFIGESDFLKWSFLLSAFFSMLNEDTLETQAGVTFFVFFYAIFLIGRYKKSPAETELNRL
ncbi:MAG: O-antigen ligase family protein [Bacteroidales bacterium]|nr:O-antigen ligase family protein [Bacteroidales bacterium]